MITALLWVIMQCIVGMHRRFETTYVVPSTGCTETSVRNYHYSLPDNPEQRSSQPHSFAFPKRKFLNISSFSLRSLFPQQTQTLI
jgi:hypothetical protein